MCLGHPVRCHIRSRYGSAVPTVFETTIEDIMKCFDIKSHSGDECTTILALVQVLPGRLNMRIWHELTTLQIQMRFVSMVGPFNTGILYSQNEDAHQCCPHLQVILLRLQKYLKL
jgi:hypothetical protein